MAKKAFTVDFQSRFYDDVANAVKYYESRQAGLGKRFNKTVIQTLKSIKLNPYYRVFYADVHCRQVGVFPYLIHYTIDTLNRLVLIEAVICAYQDPNDAYIKN
ncbi:MAG: hypothetical protein IPF63_12300 [Bacteroidetes bacterium]|nr:hypothetical protein [Bacteroidota bacterium]